MGINLRGTGAIVAAIQAAALSLGNTRKGYPGKRFIEWSSKKFESFDEIDLDDVIQLLEDWQVGHVCCGFVTDTAEYVLFTMEREESPDLLITNPRSIIFEVFGYLFSMFGYPLLKEDIPAFISAINLARTSPEEAIEKLDQYVFDIDTEGRHKMLGYSLGGHVALRAAIDPVSERLRGVVAICPPVDLLAVQQALDSRGQGVYLHYILKGLKEMYRGVASRGAVPTPVARVDMVQTLREWDALTVVPRFGYENVDDYYRRESVMNCIERLKIPALIVASPDDPMIPPGPLEALEEDAPGCLEVRWVAGAGHVFFSGKTAFGFDGDREDGGVERQVIRWLKRIN